MIHSQAHQCSNVLFCFLQKNESAAAFKVSETDEKGLFLLALLPSKYTVLHNGDLQLKSIMWVYIFTKDI